jgi:pimeloyl-ACP methyl ester carboxylesterase
MARKRCLMRMTPGSKAKVFLNVATMQFFNGWQQKVKTKMFYSMGVAAIVLTGALVGLWTPDLDRAELEKKYASPHTQFLDVKGQRVHYQDSGPKDAAVLVLLHGFGSSLQTWDTWSETLNKKYRVISLDLLGFGLTGPSPIQAYSDTDDVQLVANLLKQLHISEYALIGHSMGGKIAWNVAASYPQQVKQLILMAPDGYANPEDIGAKPYAVPAFLQLMKYCLPKYFVTKSLEPALFDANALTEDLLTRYYDFLRAPGVRQAIIERANQTINTDPVERLKKITAPTLLLWGASDQMIPNENALRYAKVLSNSTTIVLPKQGHLLQEERPQEGLAKVLAFLNASH